MVTDRDLEQRWPFLAGGGEMGARMRTLDWDHHRLGSPDAWPQSLRSMVSSCLRSPLLTTILWGPELYMLYNDAYIGSMADRHPAALGTPVSEVWGAAWEQVAPPFLEAMRTGVGFSQDGVVLDIVRRGVAETTHWDIVGTPFCGEDGRTAGILNQGFEITDQVIAQRRVASEAKRQRLIYEQMPGFIALMSGPDHIYEYVNRAFVEIAGQRDFIGRAFRDVFPEIADQGFYELVDQVYATGEPFIAQSIPVTLAGRGEERYIDLLYQPIRDEAGQVTGVLTGGYDVTDAHHDKEELKAINADLERQVSERLHERSRTWEVSPDLMSVINEDGHFERTNPAWERLLGWSSQALRRIPCLDLVHPDDLARTQAGLATLRGGEPVFRFENRQRDTKGEYHWLSWVAVPEGGKFYCTARDIDVEKTQAADLSARTAERDRLWETSEDLLAYADFDDHMLRFSPSWMRTFGRTDQQLRDVSFMDTVHPDDLPVLIAQSTKLRRTRQPVAFTCRSSHADGSWKSIAWSLVPEPGRDRFHAVGRDVTAEREAAEIRGQLEDQLRQAQKMEAVGQLTGGLAHDFNNLLAGISGSLELMQNRVNQGRYNDVDRYIAAAQGAAKRAAALTHRLLAFSRRQTLEPKSTDVNRLVFDMEELIRRTVGLGIDLEVVGAVGLWTALVDPPQLENSLLNLCINARDAMPDGGRITIETANKWLDDHGARQHDMPPGQYLSVCVTDTGTGMTPDIVEKAFDPFFTTKPIGSGTGLGLSMIYGFARQSGGQVRIYSEVGQGTTVCIYLPRHLGPVADDSEVHGLSDAPRADQGETVLIVDDEPTVRMLVTEVLEDLGYVAIEASDSVSGLKVLQSDVRIDLLVSDVGLPGGMNGRQMADAARVSRPDLKILFITGYAENAVFNNGHLEPGMQVMTKPFVMDSLASRIKEMIASPGPSGLAR